MRHGAHGSRRMGTEMSPCHRLEHRVPSTLVERAGSLQCLGREGKRSSLVLIKRRGTPAWEGNGKRVSNRICLSLTWGKQPQPRGLALLVYFQVSLS